MVSRAAKTIAEGVQEALDAATGATETEPKDDTDLDTDVLRALTDIQGADDIRWQIHRVSEPNAGYCGEVSTLELSMDSIARSFGPGKYRVKGIKTNGQYYKSALVKISTPMQTAKDSVMSDELLQKARGGDMMPLLLSMMNSNTAIVTAALNGNRQPATPAFPWPAFLVAAPALLTAIREFMAKPDPDDKSLEKVLKQLTILEKLRGADGKESNWTDVVRDALSSLPALVSRGGTATHPVSISATRAPHAVLPSTSEVPAMAGANTAALPETPEAIEATPENGAMLWLKNKLTDAVEWARLNRDPSLRAEILIEEFPTILPVPILLTLLKRDDWFEQLCTYQPACAPYRGWFEELRNELIHQLENQNNDTGRTDDNRPSE